MTPSRHRVSQLDELAQHDPVRVVEERPDRLEVDERPFRVARSLGGE